MLHMEIRYPNKEMVKHFLCCSSLCGILIDKNYVTNRCFKTQDNALQSWEVEITEKYIIHVCVVLSSIVSPLFPSVPPHLVVAGL